MASHRIAAGHSGVVKSLHEEPAVTDAVPAGSFAKVLLSGSPLCVGQFTRCCGRTSRRWICCRLFALGLPRPSVCLDAIWATGLAFDCLVWAVLAEAEFLAALTVLGGAYPPQFPLFLFSKSGPSWLCGWPALGGGPSGFASRVGGFAFLGRVLSKLAGLAKTKVDSKVPPLHVCAGRMTVGSVVRVVSGGHSPRSWRSWFCSSCNLASAWMRAWRSDSNVVMCRPVLGSYQPSWPSVQRRLRLRMVL